jgi:hypothetical protein
MKILCHVNGKPAVVVGYGPGRKGRPMAIVISEGQLRAVRLKDVKLEDFEQNVVQELRRKS